MPGQIKISKLDERIKEALLALLDSVEREDEYVRLQQMRQFKKNNLFWHGFQYLFWDDTSQDWRIPTHEEFEEISGREETRYIFDYVINVFKAHGESIIAALSADIPDVRFGPRDAYDPDDQRAVTAADNCVELIQKWNRAKLVIIQALFYLATEGFVASYTYNKKDPIFGSIAIPQYGRELQQTIPDERVCESCGYSEEATPEEPIENEPTPDEAAPTEVTPPDLNVQQANELCPACGSPMTIEPGTQEEIPVLVDRHMVPKGREVIEVYGALNVRVPSYIAKHADAGYLIHYVDADPAAFKEAFPDVKDDIGSSSEDSYERMMRQSSIISSDTQNVGTRLTTQKKVWMRPWMLNRLENLDDDVEKKMRQMFKSGIYFSAIGKVICEVRDESQDRHWTITKAGPAKGVHADPLLQSLVPLQEIHNNLWNLFVMMVEYGVPATYADTEVFDFQGQAKQEVSPGYIYPVTPRPGQSIGDGFYTEKTATLPKEATQLLTSCEQAEQFCSGSFPSIYGGPSVSGSKTLGEYDRSRSFALQRLSLVWYYLNVWWGETVHKALLSFIDHQLEDEPVTVELERGSFQTKWIRMADLKGSFDRLEPDVSSDFPSSFAQKRQLLMSLFQLNNEEINAVLTSPENANVVQSYLGLTELKIPMNSQRTKQMREILILIGFEPDQLGEEIVSTVPIEPDIDDHPIHIEVLTEFLIGDVGQDLKKNDMRSYANCLAHLLEHKRAMLPPPGLPSLGPPGLPPPGPGSMPPQPPKPPVKVNGAMQ